jgi:hypothetical protein
MMGERMMEGEEARRREEGAGEEGLIRGLAVKKMRTSRIGAATT